VRVLIAAETFLPAMNGVTRSVIETATRLRTLGHDVLVLAPATPEPVPSQPFDVEWMASTEVPRYPGLRMALPSPHIAKAVRRFRPTVLHAAAPTVLGSAAIEAAADLGVPAVAIFQTDLAGFAERHGITGVSAVVWRYLRHVHRRAAVTLVPSTATMFELRRRRFERLALWPRGVDLGLFSPDRRDEHWRREMAPNGELIVGFHGRLAPEKCVELLAPTASMRDIQLVVIGDGPSRAQLERVVPAARFLGELRGTHLGCAVASCDLAVHPGPHETFCQAVQESLAGGVPVIAPAAGGPLDLVHPGINGVLVRPLDSAAICTAVRGLRDARDHLVSLAATARASVAHRTWDHVIDRLVAHYRIALDARPTAVRRAA
jgi:phosphatidylinositol alpha 1,6-mannosyltransferase